MGKHEERLSRNDKSRNAASHFGEEWDVTELEFLMEEFPKAKGNPDEEALVAEILGRTIEACRQKFYQTRQGSTKVVSVRESITRTITRTEHYIGAYDDPEDRWWDSGTYK